MAPATTRGLVLDASADMESATMSIEAGRALLQRRERGAVCERDHVEQLLSREREHDVVAAGRNDERVSGPQRVAHGLVLCEKRAPVAPLRQRQFMHGEIDACGSAAVPLDKRNVEPMTHVFARRWRSQQARID
jgi:hypothetical protein